MAVLLSAEDKKYARDVLRAETANMRWDDWIKETVDRAPPLSSEQVIKLRALFGWGRR
jgi:hypothetical protein